MTGLTAVASRMIRAGETALMARDRCLGSASRESSDGVSLDSLLLPPPLRKTVRECGMKGAFYTLPC